MAKVDSKFTLVTLSSMRAREINDYYNQLGEGLGRIVPPQVTSVSRKPLSIAMEEVAAGKIIVRAHRPGRATTKRPATSSRSRPTTPRATPRPERHDMTGQREPARVVLGVCRRHRRVQGRRSVPPARRRRRARRAGAHRRRAALRRRAHVLGARVGAGAHRRCSAGPEPIPHTRLGQTADLVVVAPATAKLIGKYAAGISDDLLTATLLATRAPVLVCPAMHTEMWEHAAVQENLATLRAARRARARTRSRPPRRRRRRRSGRLADPERIVARGRGAARLARRSAGGPAGARDRGRHARADRPGALRRQPLVGEDGPRDRRGRARGGARTSCSSPPRASPSPPGSRSVAVETAEQMRDAVLARADDCDVVVMAAAVADFRPKAVAAREAEEGRRRARDRARADRRHPRRARRRASARTRSSWASRPRPSASGSTRRPSSRPSASTSWSPTT